jgi:hypothetical protein
MSDVKQDGPKTGPQIDPVMIYPMGAIGAVVGAALGIGVMVIGLRSGFYAEVAIGLLAGWIAGLLARRPNWGVGIIAGVVTLVAGVWAEWKFAGAMKADDSFGYFEAQFFELAPFKLLSHAIGVGVEVWFGAKR